jgi:hypothetical protein
MMMAESMVVIMIVRVIVTLRMTRMMGMRVFHSPQSYGIAGGYGATGRAFYYR